MIFKSRNQEYAIRLTLAVILVFVLFVPKDDKVLITYLFPNKILSGIIMALLIMAIGWLNWGKLVTPRKQKSDSGNK